MTVITLTRLHFNSSGSYKCEVSTDRPNFETVVRNGNMTVMAFPNDIPKIDGIHTWYNVGDYISGNCTSMPSNPAAELSWYINQNKSDSWLLRKYPVMTTDEYLYSQALGIHFQLDKSHFGNKSQLELRCTAKIADLPEWHRTVTIQPAYSRLTNEKPAPDRYRNNFGPLTPPGSGSAPMKLQPARQLSSKQLTLKMKGSVTDALMENFRKHTLSSHREYLKRSQSTK
ncbi:hypothetical protein V9T40_013753 [Parthenolecanium corni]|uniref:Ig-like domain-containing protein n=1 Tax=Parthenolecanium corni TaxID=536013 RepID=A0AAN9Y2S0_9HEMI